jgi:5-carboxymethyl-2-hydroxymuconate isomerase
MPHFMVEYTANIKAEARIPELLKKGTEVLAGEGYPLLGMRARGLAFDEYVLADGRDCAMVHVTLKVAPGHPVEKKQRTCIVVFEMLKAHFAELFARRYLLLSVELQEIVSGDGGPTLKTNNLGDVLAPRGDAPS